MKTVCHRWETSGDIMVSFTVKLIPDEDFDLFIKAMKSNSIKRFVSMSVGIVEASSVQRKQAADIFKALDCVVAVVTDERLVRGMVTALAWLGVPRISAFSHDESDQALTFVGIVSPQERATALGMIKRLQKTA